MIRSAVNRLRSFVAPRSGLRFFIRNWLVPGDVARAAQVFATMRASRVLVPQVSAGPVASRIAAIAPHPDDEVIGPGGTLLRAVADGAAITVVYVTDGDAEDVGVARRGEAEAAAKKLGFKAVFLGERPGAINCEAETVTRFAQAVQRADPEALFVPFLLDDNDDHRRINQLLFSALRRGLLPGALELWAYQVYAPLPGNLVVDITDVARHKGEAIRLYASQIAKRDWAHFALGRDAVSSRLLPGAPAARYAESFFVMSLRDYAELCAAYFEPDATPCYLWEPYRRA